MKKIFTLVLAICAVSVVLGGCSGEKAAEEPTKPAAEGEAK
ncbi:MAG: hypothetical protein ABL962_20760 [Fimbriimonadaceae bacterium]